MPHPLPSYYCVPPSGSQAFQLAGDLIRYGKEVLAGGITDKRCAASCVSSLLVWGADMIPDNEGPPWMGAASSDLAACIDDCEKTLTARSATAGADLKAFDWKKVLALALKILPLIFGL